MGGATSPGLKGAISRIEKFATSFRPAVAKRLAPRIDQRIRDMFTNETDPYGRKWPPLAASTLQRKRNSPGGSIILSRTFELANSSYALYTGKRIVITYGPSGQYAHEGDSGRGNRAPRLILPSFGMPKTWNSDAQDAADEVAAMAKI
jgi:hypothetical protein